MKKILSGVLLTLSALVMMHPVGKSWAQGAAAAAPAGPTSSYEERKRETNENVVTIIASGTASPYTIFAEDMRNVLDQQNVPGGLRVLPVLGRGGGQNAVDVLLLKGIDMGIMEQSDVQIASKKDPTVFANADERLRYITKLANSEFQILALNEIKTVKDLAGRKVNCFKKGSSTRIACERIFSTLGINIDEVNYDQAVANQKMRSKEIVATIRFAGAPHNAFKSFTAADGVHFLAISPDVVPEQAFNKLLTVYSPALLKNEYYPELVPADKPVPTVAGAMLLVVYNWPPNTERYNRVANFINEFFSNIEKFATPGHHPKWKEINLAATVPGWTRFKPAQDWLDKWRQAEKDATSEMRTAFDTFVKTRSGIVGLSGQQREVLFSQFMRWWNTKKTSQR